MPIKRYRINERILAPQVRVIDPEGEQLGIMPVEQAREEALNRELDLIELAPESDPPVCRIMDYGKFRYEQQKKAKQAAKQSKQSGLKYIRVRPNTGEHDISFKLQNTLKFLKKGHKVRINVIFRGPELRHKQIGRAQLQRFIDGSAEVADVDQSPHMEGRQMVMTLHPRSSGN